MFDSTCLIRLVKVVVSPSDSTEVWEVSHAIAPPSHLVISFNGRNFVIRNKTKKIMVSILLHAQIEHSIDTGAYDRQSSTPVTAAAAESLVPRISVVYPMDRSL